MGIVVKEGPDAHVQDPGSTSRGCWIEARSKNGCGFSCDGVGRPAGAGDVALLGKRERRPSLTSEAAVNHQFAVIDVETTGLYPGGHDRVVEVGIVRLDAEGCVTAEYETLVNPCRDLGPTWLHGVEARDVVEAPEFGEICGAVARLVSEAVVVGHNVSFDLRFVEAEFHRAGFGIPAVRSIDTGPVARMAGDGARSGRLEDVCASFGIAVGTAHSALGDARATAALFAACLSRVGPSEIIGTARTRVPSRGRAERWPVSARSAPPVPRAKAVARRRGGRPFVVEIVADLPAAASSSDWQAYYDALDRALEDRRISADEVVELRTIARESGLSSDDVRAANREYLTSLVRVALRDGIISDLEARDLDDVASLLGLSSELRPLLEEVGTETDGSRNGDDAGLAIAGCSVCFTGALRAVVHGSRATRSLAGEIATSRGMFVRKSVTKDLDYLVTSDPDSMSGKAGKARKYGVRILAESVFWNLMGVDTGT
jgi:DNA polymerase III subunit epsilon